MTLIWANRAYAILRHELANVGVNDPDPKALDMVSLGNPDLDWVSLANGMGVEAKRVDTVDELILAFAPE
jgi:acetolactate synthase I/II/III large subunit